MQAGDIGRGRGRLHFMRCKHKLCNHKAWESAQAPAHASKCPTGRPIQNTLFFFKTRWAVTSSICVRRHVNASAGSGGAQRPEQDLVLKIEGNSFLYRTSSRALACLHVQVLVHSLTLYDDIIYLCISWNAVCPSPSQYPPPACVRIVNLKVRLCTSGIPEN